MIFLPIFLYICGLSSPIVIDIGYGKLEGYQKQAKNEKIVNIFKRIPYASPPLGRLRFQKPQPPIPWKGIWNATTYGPACMSNSSTSSSLQKWVDEDCLHINLFAGAGCLNKPCPVVFYIHGGGFNYDSAVMFNDEVLINNFGANDIVLAIPAFRLGFFSLLTFDNDNIVPRNLPVYDLIFALQWIQEKIRHFGGNPNDVTLFGHSSGAAAVFMISFSKSIDPKQKLFHKSIAMSPGMDFTEMELKKDLTWDLAFRSGCSTVRKPINASDIYVKKVVSCLQYIDGKELLRIQRVMEDEDVNRRPEDLIKIEPLFPSSSWRDFFVNPPSRPLMIGSTSKELDDSEDGQEKYFAKYLGFTNVDDVIRKYRTDKESGKLKFNHSTNTQSIFLSVYVVAHQMRKTGKNVYLYSYKNSQHPEHTDDLFYIMGVHLFEPNKDEEVLAKLYPRLFLNFIKTGKPNDDWEQLQAVRDNYYYIDVRLTEEIMPHNADHYESEVIDYWLKEMMEYDEKITYSKYIRNESVENTIDVRNLINSPQNLNNMDIFREPLISFQLSIILVVLFFVIFLFVGKEFYKKKTLCTYNDSSTEKTPLVTHMF